MSQSLVQHTIDLLETLQRVTQTAETEGDIAERHIASLQGLALCQAIKANAEVAIMRFEQLADKLENEIVAAQETNAKVSEMAEAEM